jgi:hypothetical protein
MGEAVYWLKIRFNNEKESKLALPEVKKIMKYYVEKEEGGLGNPDVNLFKNIIVVSLEDNHMADDEWVKISDKIQNLNGANAIYFINDENFPDMFMDMLNYFPDAKDARGYATRLV